MKKIDLHNQHLAMEIITHAFRGNPNMLWVVKKDHKVNERMKVLCDYILQSSIEKQGAFLSDDNLGVLLAYPNTRSLSVLSAIRLRLKLIRHCIGWDRVLEVWRRQYRFDRLRPREKHIYCIMLAVKNNSNGMHTVLELKDGLYAMSDKFSLPVFAETSVYKSKVAYERYGFKTYATFKNADGGLSVWFLRR